MDGPDPDPGGLKMYFNGLNGRLDGKSCCIGTRLEIYLPHSLSSTVLAGQCVSLLCVYVDFFTFFLGFITVLWIRIGSVFNRVPRSGSGSGRAKITHKNKKKLINFSF
jgi:hypothetical protein